MLSASGLHYARLPTILGVCGFPPHADHQRLDLTGRFYSGVIAHLVYTPGIAHNARVEEDTMNMTKTTNFTKTKTKQQITK